MMNWIRTTKALDNLTAMEKGGFSKQENKRSNREIFSELLQEKGPFALDARFPEGVEYIAWGKMDWPSKKTQILEALDHVENTEARDKRVTSPGQSSSRDTELQKFSRDDAIHAFYQGIRRCHDQIVNQEGIYDRLKFEDEMMLIWVEPARTGTGGASGA